MTTTRPLRVPRRPAVKPHYEPRETEFVSLLLAEDEAARIVAEPTPMPVAVDDGDDDDLPPYARPGAVDKVPLAELARPVPVHTRKLK